jgi:transposase
LSIFFHAIPLSAINNDVLLALPMLKRLEHNNINNYCYVLMDKGFSSDYTREFVMKKGKKPLIDYNKSNCKDPSKLRGFDNFEKEIYKNRTDVERFYGDLKDNYGVKTIYVKGNKKVKLTITFAILAMLVKKTYQERKRNEKANSG